MNEINIGDRLKEVKKQQLLPNEYMEALKNYERLLEEGIIQKKEFAINYSSLLDQKLDQAIFNLSLNK